MCKIENEEKKPVTKGRKAKVTLTIINFCHKIRADILKSNAQAIKCCRSYNNSAKQFINISTSCKVW